MGVQDTERHAEIMKKRQFVQTLSLLILCCSFCCTVLFGAKQSRMWGIISCREMTFMERRKKKRERESGEGKKALAKGRLSGVRLRKQSFQI